MNEALESQARAVSAIAKELRQTMQCNCDLDRWEPEKISGHSWVCRIHKKAWEIYRAGLQPTTEQP